MATQWVRWLFFALLFSAILVNVLSQRRRMRGEVNSKKSTRVSTRQSRVRTTRKNEPLMTKEGKSRSSRKRQDQTTVVSCRVFQRGVCKKSKNNVIAVNKDIQGHGKCQRLCYAKDGCSAFTYYRGTEKEPRKCVLFRDCNGQLAKCEDCVSGPIMPRIGECLAERQVEAPPPPPEKKPCQHGNCVGICVGPACTGLLEGQQNLATGLADNVQSIPDVVDEASIADYDTYDNYSDNQDDVDEYTADAGDYDTPVTDYDEYEDSPSTADYDTDPPVYDNYEDDYGDTALEEEYDYEDENIDVTFPLDDDLEEEEEEEEEEIEVEIDDGLLSDQDGTVVTFPSPQNNLTNSVPTFLFYFCALGGFNQNGAQSAIEVINTGVSLPAFSVSPLPSMATRGGGSISAAYTGRSILSCSQGYTVLTPYGFIYQPGTCYDYNLTPGNSRWSPTGGQLTTYRHGGSIVRLGRFMFALGGLKEEKALRSVEMFDPRRPKSGWRRVARMTMPAATAEHCAVVMEGRRGKEVVITGGRSRENRAIKLDVKTNRWYSLNRLSTGRRQHACAKVSLNGRPGVVVSGGHSRQETNVSSVEFYDARTGGWFSLPSLNTGRAGHVMTVTEGKLMVAGGEAVGRRGRKIYLDDTEVFTGKKWVKSRVKLDKPRSGFSLVKVPKKENLTDKRKGRRGQGSTRKKKESRRKKQSKSRRTQVRRPRKGYRRESTSRTSS